MGIFDFLRARGNIGTQTVASSPCSWNDEGVVYEFVTPLAEVSVEALLDAAHSAGREASTLGVYLSELVQTGRCVLTNRGALVDWASVFTLTELPEYASVIDAFGLPPARKLSPIVGCSGAFSDTDFELKVAGWVDGARVVRPDGFEGAVVVFEDEKFILPAAAWRLKEAIEGFRRRPTENRNQYDHELAWGQIRRLAVAASATFEDEYLRNTVVITPESLRLPMSRDITPLGAVTTVAPTFDEAPDGWLDAFDKHGSVQPHYDFTRAGGRVRVMLSEPVQQVLGIIKREMPGRKVAGAKAERFIRNPWAVLGEVAQSVIKEDQFQQDRAEAGPVAAIFNLVARTAESRLSYVELCVTEHFASGHIQTDLKKLEEPEVLETFLRSLNAALEQERERFPWDEYDLSIDAESSTQLEVGRQLLSLWRAQPAERIDLEDIYELSHYSARIEGIGPTRPIYVPVFQIPKVDGEESSVGYQGDLTPIVRVTLPDHEGDVLVELNRDWVKQFQDQVEAAEQAGAEDVVNDRLPTKIETAAARELLDSIKSVIEAEDRVRVDRQGKKGEKSAKGETLLIKLNFNEVDFDALRQTSLSMPREWTADLPSSLRPEIELKAHQLYGIAWFQNLMSKGHDACSGALLADDMGLGKTVQLLSVLARFYEDNPTAPPSIVFAPKSLLENWASEAGKFFTPDFPETLVLYGDALTQLKQPQGLIDEELREKGVCELLQPSWANRHKLFITTYEVLCSYEFSFAKQQFAMVICDEAQRIKTPGTIVTLATKKLKAEFKVACTGTPVENTLADLWCLFDFVQPGLLGALGDFGQTYRRPIECVTAELQAALVRLQETIAPQTLRRTKANIAAELPRKLFAVKRADESMIRFLERPQLGERLEVEMSEHQRALYKAGLRKLQAAGGESDGRQRVKMSFGALHLMKAVCAEPYCLPGTRFGVDSAGAGRHLSNSPKLAWLLRQLAAVRDKGEKAIVFTELREVQAALYHFLRAQFDLRPIIIHGESEGRQASINRFSAKAGFDVIILSTLAAGAGLNITAANHVFHFTRAWNPAKEAQATDRAYRIGAKKDVHVYCPTVVTDFVTFEQRLDELLWRKSNLADAALDSGGLAAMLNGTGSDATISDLIRNNDVTSPIDGAAPARVMTMLDVDRLDGFGFEVFCALLWGKRGFLASVTKKNPGDGGVDVVALKGKEGELIQCKVSGKEEIGWDALKEVHSGAALYGRKYAKTKFRLIAVTNQSFNAEAQRQAGALHVCLVTRRDLELMVGKHPVSSDEFDDALFHATEGNAFAA